MEEQQQQQTRTVQVTQLSDLASEREIHEFFSFSGEIDCIQIQREDGGQSRTAYVTFVDPKALEIALLLSGATIVDRLVTITPVENYVPERRPHHGHDAALSASVAPSPTENEAKGGLSSAASNNGRRMYVNKAQDVVASVIARSSAIRQDAVNRAKAFDEKHQLMEKLNERVKAVDQRLQVSDKTMAAVFAAERKINSTGSAVKTSRYVTAGTAWLNGAFSKVARASQVATTKTREKFHTAISNLTAKESPIAT